MSRKLGLKSSVTKHPYPCVVHQVKLPERIDFPKALELGFKSKTADWVWTEEDLAVLKLTFETLMKKIDWIHTKDVYHWFSQGAFNGRISKASICSKINEINHDDDVKTLN